MYYREAKECYQDYVAFVTRPGLSREEFDQAPRLPDPNIFGVPGQYGIDELDFRLPEPIVAKAKLVVQKRQEYSKNCFCEAVPEIAESGITTLVDFHNWTVDHKDQPFIANSGSKFSREEVFKGHGDKNFEKRADFATVMLMAADLMGEMSSYFETHKDLSPVNQ